MAALRSHFVAVAVTAFVAALLVGAASAAPVPKGAESKSWVGKTVMPKKCSTPADSDDPRAPFDAVGTREQALYSASWEVKAEKGTRVEVLEGDISYWVEKDRLVPLGEAVAFYTKSMRDDDGQTDGYAHNFSGWAKHLLGKNEEAVKDFDEFLKVFTIQEGPGCSDRAFGLSNRGLVLAEMGRFDAAITDLDEAVRLGNASARLNRGRAYERKGSYGRAEADYALTLRLRPADLAAMNHLARLRATCPDAAFRDGKEAVKLAEKACELTGNREGTYLDTLAAAHAEARDFAAAVAAQEKALEDAGYARRCGAEAQARLRLYQDKKPVRSQPRK